MHQIQDQQSKQNITSLYQQQGEMSKLEAQQVQLSSESDPQQLDLDEINDIRVDQKDLQQLDFLIATTKKNVQEKMHIQPVEQTMQLDRFFRNFFIRHNMNETLNNFQQQWFQLTQKGQQVQGTQNVPQQYVQSQNLKDQIKKMKDELDKAVIMAEKARGTYDKLLKQRNFYKMHHQRVQQEKKKMNGDLDKLRSNHIQYEKKYDQMADKYSHLMKQKMLIKLERDRLKTRAQIQKEMAQANTVGQQQHNGSNENTEKSIKSKDKVKFTPFPPDQRINPHVQDGPTEAFDYRNILLYKTFPGHQMAVTGLALHPKKPILGTVSDDLTWKIYTVPQGELIMSGQGHKDWLTSIRFHPNGRYVLTASGDSTVKIWDFINTSCTHTFKDHIQPIWDVDVHDTGDFFATASMDHLAKIFDFNVGKCRHSLRGHVDSVNAVHFQPFSNIVATASADKTVSLWDMKTSLCVQTFYGHNNSVNDCTFNLQGDKIATCDSDGIVKVWDVRMVKEKQTFDTGSYAANCVAFDGSGTIVGVGLDKGQIKLYNQSLNKLEATLKGHQDAVQDLIFDPKAKTIYSCGSDSTFRIWQ